MGNSVGKFFRKWYNEGIDTDPPPCLKNKTFYCICSENAACYFVGLMGTEWGDRNRSQIFFVAFWLSLLGLLMLCNGMATFSRTPSSIVSMPMFQGRLQVTENGTTSHYLYYAGMDRMVIRGECKGDELCSPSSLGWEDDSCSLFFINCEECNLPKNSVAVPIVMSLLGQLGQTATDLNRSTVKFDLHCQKFIGLFAGVMGMVGTFMALTEFGTGCIAKLHISPDITAGMTRRPSTAFAMICMATLLRLYDLWAHIIVPVPKVDYWRPDGLRNLLQVEMATEMEVMERDNDKDMPGNNEPRYPAKLHPINLQT